MTTEYSSTTIWMVFFATGIGAFVLRSSFIFLIGKLDDIPPWVEGALRFVPPAVLAAIVIPAVLLLSLEPSLRLVFETEKLLALALAGVVAWQTDNFLATIGIGMVILWGFQTIM
ncbi:AzlD domain-containing protein [Haladaptatus pallidirubidus]|uniref:Branched-chain amino acid transport protein n=1 Tax=Haladaptatus pallidirubidus TaxID=1008152 RepID=A0AAV3UHZ0_9EURY|nr:AzlD domain-containing protein [Haladaptatus pallidirubidus]